MQQLTEDEFDSRFTVVPDPVTGDTIRPSDQGLAESSRNNLWTIVEGDAGEDLYAVSGWHYVNRIGYIVTEEPWDDDTQAEWCVQGFDDEEEG